jgi:hypothetical protein
LETAYWSLIDNQAPIKEHLMKISIDNQALNASACIKDFIGGKMKQLEALN